jgi:tRNA-uridine 2-sulfurtransferase
VTAVGRLLVRPGRIEAKLRYRSPGVPASVDPLEGGFRLSLSRPAYGVAKGQAAVLYEDGAVVGAGIISATGPA